MSGEYQRSLLAGVHPVAPVVKLMERGVGVPGLVKMQNINAVAEGPFDQVGVVAKAVVGRVGYDRQPHPGRTTTGERVGVDLGLNRFW